MIRVCTTCRSERSESTARPICSWVHVLQLIHVHGRGKRRDFCGNRLRTQLEFTLHAGLKAAPATVEPGTGNNGNNGNNGDSSSANANANVNNTVNNNGDNASSEAKMATVKTGDNLALVGGAIAVIAVAAAGVAAFALRRKKMN